jgi:galactose mutarotase-like enzyme
MQLKVVSVCAAEDNCPSSAVAVFGYTFDGGDPGYPFQLRVEITYTLDEKGFHMEVTAFNDDPSGW